MMLFKQSRPTAYNMILGPVLMAVLIALTGTGVAQGQQTVSILEIAELGAIITDSPDGPRVLDVTPAAARLEQYREVDLQAGDLIVAANGERTTKLSTLRGILESAEPGDDIRLGVQRTGGLAVARYGVGTEEECQAARELAASAPEVEVTTEGQGRVMRKMVRMGEGEPGELEGGGEGGPTMVRKIVTASPGDAKTMSIEDALAAGGEVTVTRIESSEGDVPWLDLSVILQDGDNQAVVAQELGLPLDEVSNVELRVGDRLTAINGTTVSSAGELVKIYYALKSGDKVSLAVIRDGEQLVMNFDKPQNTSTQIMK